MLGDQAEHARLLAGDEDRRPSGTDRLRKQLHVLRAMPAALEAHRLAAQQRRDDLHPLVEAAHAVVERVAEGVELRLVPAAAEAQDQPPSADLVQLGGHLRHERGVPERERQHERADLDPRGDRGNGGEHGPRLVDAERALVVAEDEVVRAPHRVEPGLLGRERHGAQVGEAARLVGPEGQHQSDLHARHASVAPA